MVWCSPLERGNIKLSGLRLHCIRESIADVFLPAIGSGVLQ